MTRKATHLTPHGCDDMQAVHVKHVRQNGPPNGIKHVVSVDVETVTKTQCGRTFQNSQTKHKIKTMMNTHRQAPAGPTARHAHTTLLTSASATIKSGNSVRACKTDRKLCRRPSKSRAGRSLSAATMAMRALAIKLQKET